MEASVAALLSGESYTCLGVSISTVTYMLNNPESLEGLSREDVIKYNLVHILKLWLLGRE